MSRVMSSEERVVLEGVADALTFDDDHCLATWEAQYLLIMCDLLTSGEHRAGRNGGTSALFARSLTVDVERSFPAPQTKRLFWRGVATELCWMLRGESTLEFLREHDVNIWNEWARPGGDLGPIYGAQLRGKRGGAGGVDQIAELIDGLITRPHGRRHVMTTWRPDQIPDMALPPCHGVMIQLYAHTDGGLSMMMHQRSADWFLGVPFNIASYAAMLSIICKIAGFKPRTLHMSFGDAHIYDDHRAACLEQLSRVEELSAARRALIDRCDPMDPPKPARPRLQLMGALSEVIHLDALTPDQLKLKSYRPMPTIKAPISA